MNNNLNSKITLMTMFFLISGCIKGGENKDHPIENQFPQDTSLRIYLASSTPITANPATDSKYVKIIQDFMSKQ